MNGFICMLKVPYSKIFTSPMFSKGHHQVSIVCLWTFHEREKKSIDDFFVYKPHFSVSAKRDTVLAFIHL